MAELVDEWRWDVPLRLLGGVHYLVLKGEASWQRFREALAEHRDFLRRFVAERGVQTNEVQRSWMLVPLFLGGRRTRCSSSQARSARRCRRGCFGSRRSFASAWESTSSRST